MKINLLKKYYLALFFIPFFVSCVQNNDTNFPNTFTLNSNQNTGFSFGTMSVVNDTINNYAADFVVVPQLNDSGQLLTPILIQLKLRSNFVLARQFDTLSDAKNYYDSYITFSEDPAKMDIYALMIKPYQVWVIKTGDNTYGKVLIISTKTEYLNKSYYSEITFKADLLE